MELKQFEALRAIAETGSFSAAAGQLHLTQSALSHQIRRFEEELGETLLVRAKPRVYPSPAGVTVLASAERIFAEILHMREHFRPTEGDTVVGTLRVAASNLGIVYLYGDLCEEFIARYPKVELIFTATETPLDGVRKVIARTVDIAFAPFPVEFPNLETRTLGTAEHVVLVRRNHPLTRKGTVAVDELKRWPFIRYLPGAGSRAMSDQLFLARGGYPSILTESNDTEFIKRVVSMGLGVALVPLFTVYREVAAGSLTALRLAHGRIAQEFGLVHRRGLRMRALDAFRALCMERRGRIPTHALRVRPPRRAARARVR